MRNSHRVFALLPAPLFGVLSLFWGIYLLSACSGLAPRLVYKELALTEETFSKIETHYVGVPDYSKIRLGALLGLSKALPPGSFSVTESGRQLAIRYRTDENPSGTEKVFMSAGDSHQALSDVIEAYRIARRVSPSLDSARLERGMLRSAVESLDSDSTFFDPETYRETAELVPMGGIGIEITIRSGEVIVVRPLEGTPAYREHIAPGDRIESINEASVEGLRLEEVVKMLRGPRGSSVNVRVWRVGWPESRTITFYREAIRSQSINVRLLEEGIGLITMRQFDLSTPKRLDEALLDLESHSIRGLILDLRNNSGGVLDSAAAVTGRFLEPGVLVAYTVGRAPDQSKRYSAQDGRPRIDIPMVVVVDKRTSAGAEAVAAKLQEARRAIILGSATFGHSSVYTFIPLSDGSAIRLTVAKWFTASGRSVAGRGVVPDIEIEGEPVDYFLIGDLERDTYLQRAIQTIRRQ